jgi:Protein of unknown function (DUF2591)
MLIKTSELIGAALDWAVAKCEGRHELATIWVEDDQYGNHIQRPYSPSTDWAQGGPIIECEGISVIKLEHTYSVDSKGYTTSKRIPVFGAVIGEYFDTDQQRNSYGESYGDIYYVGGECVMQGPTLLIAAMRCYVASNLGNEVEVPDELF